MQEIVISFMNPIDLKNVCEIEESVFSDPWSQRMFQEELRLPYLYTLVVAKIDEQLVAYGGLLNIHDEAHITNLGVHLDFQSKGVGSLLLRELIKIAIAKGVSFLSL